MKTNRAFQKTACRSFFAIGALGLSLSPLRSTPRRNAVKAGQPSKMWLLALLLVATFNIFTSPCFAQGSLTPPGAPAPTMKTLDQVEPRIPIDATHTPGDANSLFKITQSGSYYLTGNITGVAGKHGILAAVTGQVTLDLNGYELIGVASSLDGINVSSGGPITIRNGWVHRWDGVGVNYSAASGTCEDLKANDNAGGGILIGGGVIQHCAATNNGSFGIQAGRSTTVRDCEAFGNGADGFSIGQNCTIAGCVADGNTLSGFATGDKSTLTNCVAQTNFGTAGISLGNSCSAIGCASNSSGPSVSGIAGGTGCLLAHCVVTNNPGGGISVSTGANVQNCIARSNTGGIITGAASTIIGCAATGNTAIGILTGSDCTINDCTVQGNTGNGIQVVDRCQITGSTSNGNGSGATGSGITGGIRTMVKNCTAADNRKSGIAVSGDSVVLENHASHNGLGGAAAGIDTTVGSGTDSRIEGNRTRDNVGTGILGGSSDVIIRNFSTGSATPYNPASGVNFGPIETPSTSTHPTANF